MVRLRQGISCERVGDSWLVLCDRDGVVHSLTGSAATVIDCVTTGQPVPSDCDDAVATLVDAGILTPDTGWSRRKVLAAGGAAAAIGMVTLTLPTAAMAASVSPFGSVTATAGSNQVTIDWTAAASTSYQVVYKPTVGAGDYVTFGGSVAAGPVAVTGLTNDTSYSFKVQVVGSSPLIESAVVTATPSATPIANLGTTWTAAAAAEANTWRSVAYGNGVWVAVALSGTNRVMRSTDDGLNWTAVAAAEANQWYSVAYGNGVWVAVAFDGDNRVMRSTDNGASWTAVGTAAGVAANNWSSVAYGMIGTTAGGVERVPGFVAVSQSGSGNRVMTSPDGINWTGSNAAGTNQWQSVAYGMIGTTAGGVERVPGFVAVANSGFSQVMTSPDGINWTGRSSSELDQWSSVAYGNGWWVAVATNGFDWVMTSPDGINWTGRKPAANNQWRSVAYGNGVWVAVALGGDNQVMRSTDDGETWTAVAAAEANQWYSVAYGNGKFVAVAQDGINRVMYSPSPAP
jgi:hypothetical protein